jgi:hypothetical protein
MTDIILDVQKAYSFYKTFILTHTRDEQKIYAEYGFSLEGSIGSTDWEVFAAILVGDTKKAGYGADLHKHEVKSAIAGGSFEYQYHKLKGHEKLIEDKQVDHVFISHSADFCQVDVWLVKADKIRRVFDSWEPELLHNYDPTETKVTRHDLPQ